MSTLKNVAIVGATGAVGAEMIRCLEERKFPVGQLTLLASARSAGKKLKFKGEDITIQELTPDSFKGIDIALFSAGGGISRDFAPHAVKAGAVVVDNSSFFRQDPNVPLEELASQSREWASENRAWDAAKLDSKPHVYPHQIAFNAIPHVDSFLDSGYTKEEMKMENEGRKIMHHDKFRASVTCVRIPVFRAHSIAISAEFEKPVTVAAAREVLSKAPGLDVLDDPSNKVYPLALDIAGRDNCAVGRLRMDCALDNGLAFWVVGDQLLKGAALNAVQIAECLV